MFVLARQMIDEAARNSGQAVMRRVLLDYGAANEVFDKFPLENRPEQLHLQILDGCIYMYVDGDARVLDVETFYSLNDIFAKHCCQVAM